MAISLPYSVAGFWETFNLLDGSSEFELLTYNQQSMDGGGNFVGAKLADSKWTADVSVAPLYDTDAKVLEAKINTLRGRDGTFFAYDKRRAYPAYDPTGAIVAGSTVLVKTKGSNNRSLSLKGFTGGALSYALKVGERISITNGTLVALFEVQEDTAAASGNTPEFEVLPYLPSWIAVDQAVTIAKAPGKFKIVRGSYKRGTIEARRTVGKSFQMISVY